MQLQPEVVRIEIKKYKFNMETINFVDLKKQYSVIESDVNESLAAILKSGQFILGPVVEKAEDALSQYTNANHAITVSSGTDALFVSLLALGIGPGSKVFIPAFTYTATAEVIALLGAEPAFVDVDEDTYNISCDSLTEKINHYQRSELSNSAIIAVDLFGLPADYNTIYDIAVNFGLHLISDAAQSFGGSIENQKVGKLSPVTTTSFYPTKPLSCYGDGGAVFTDDDELAMKIKSIRSHGITDNPYENIRIGTNARFDAMQAAVILSKLKIFDEELGKRENTAQIYNQELKGVVKTPTITNQVKSAWAHYTIRTRDRDELRKFLTENNIPTMIYYPKGMHEQTAYKKYHNGNPLIVSEKLCGEVLSLPLHPYMSEDQVYYVSEKVKEFIG
tara:strand:- start:7811 stop:8983 length:1173 start_codon:yes stop_codon:yes gene_type:complete